MPAIESNLVVDAVIVAHNCSSELAETMAQLPRRVIRSTVVVDSGSVDETAAAARDRGALVLRNSRGGYGRSCLAALAHLEALPRPPDVVAFVDPLQAEDPGALAQLLEPMVRDHAELVVAGGAQARVPHRERALLRLMTLVYGQEFASMSGFRAIRFPALVALGLSDPEDGWNVEMQVKAVCLGLHVVEVDVPIRSEKGRRHRSSASRKLYRILRHATAR